MITELKIAPNLKVTKHVNGSISKLYQPKTGQGIHVGDNVWKIISNILGESNPQNSEEILTTEILKKELIERGIVIPSSTIDYDNYFQLLAPLQKSAPTFFETSFAKLHNTKINQLGFLGVPSDLGASRPGCRYGPKHLRNCSSLSAFRGGVMSLNSNKNIDFSNLVCDLGDLQLQRKSSEDQLNITESVFKKIKNNITPFMVGGDHSFTLPAVLGLTSENEEFTFVQFDSHLDIQTWGEFKDNKPVYLEEAQHANFVSHLMNKRPKMSLLQLGARHFQSISKKCGSSVAQYLSSNGSRLSDLDLQTLDISSIKNLLPKNQKVYLSIDCDVLNAQFMSLTGFPNPTGISLISLIKLTQEVIKNNIIIGMDLMEFGSSQSFDQHRREGETLATLMLTLIESWSLKNENINHK